MLILACVDWGHITGSWRPWWFVFIPQSINNEKAILKGPVRNWTVMSREPVAEWYDSSCCVTFSVVSPTINFWSVYCYFAEHKVYGALFQTYAWNPSAGNRSRGLSGDLYIFKFLVVISTSKSYSQFRAPRSVYQHWTQVHLLPENQFTYLWASANRLSSK